MKPFKEVWEKVKDIELVQVHDVEMEALYNRCIEFDNPLAVEIGCAHGASSTILAEAVIPIGGVLVCIDHFPEEYEGQELFGDYARRAFQKNVLDKYNQLNRMEDVRHVDQESSLVDLSEEGIDVGVQILFIDGDHSYEGVTRDCLKYLPTVSSGGYVAFHDYNNVKFSGVKKAADEHTQGWEVTDNVWDLVIKRKP